jgi:tryptophan synthase alpha subunit
MNCAPYANPVTAVNIRAFFCEIIDADVDIVVDTPTRNDSNVTRRARVDRGVGDW